MLKSFYLSLPDEIISEFQIRGFPKYRAEQMLSWIYTKFVCNPFLMTNLPAAFREEISKSYDFSLPEVSQTHIARDSTTKFVLTLQDGNQIETVLIPAVEKNTICISSQVGCSRNCLFCATGKMGFVRNLKVEEIISQFIIVSQHVFPARISNIVFMGMGEPMDNLSNVIQALNILQSNKGVSFSPRRTTISTCGVIPGIKTLSDSEIKTKLAVSLNSALDKKRDFLMPINKSYPLSELKMALHNFRNKTSYRITLEYIMIPEFNMGEEDIRALKKFAADLSCKINLIPFNPVADSEFRSPTEREIGVFHMKLNTLKQAVTMRRSAGSDISAACGQLVTRSKKHGSD